MPKGTVVGHKTGLFDTKNGITAASNDIGIVTLPSGKIFTLSVFVSDSRKNDDTNAQIIAEISKMTWDYFTK